MNLTLCYVSIAGQPLHRIVAKKNTVSDVEPAIQKNSHKQAKALGAIGGTTLEFSPGQTRYRCFSIPNEVADTLLPGGLSGWDEPAISYPPFTGKKYRLSVIEMDAAEASQLFEKNYS